MKVVLATGNAGKLAEMQALLGGLGYEVVPQTELAVPEAVEDGLSFVENSLIKARNAAKHTGLPAIADDSGLVVDALQGRPGIYSARYSGENATDASNVALLLNEMQGQSQRSARFFCAMTFVAHADDPTPLIATAGWEGEIALVESGEGGFGYDPVFYVASEAKVAAELTRQRKSELSHRGQAARLLVDQLNKK